MWPSTHPGKSRLPLFAVAVAVALAAGLVFVAAAGADAISPEAGPTENAVKIDTLYKIVFFVGLGVIFLVWGVLAYSLVRFRASRERRPPQIRGNTALELGWTIGASTLALAVGIVAIFYLNDIRDPLPSGPAELAEVRGQNAAINQPAPPGGDALAIKVAGQQYLWRYQYPNGAVSFHDMIVPKDTTVTLDITSNDVAHSWWIPKLGGKLDAIRGLTNETWFKATQTGTFDGRCGEYCGTNHAYMSARVIVVEPDEYERWVDEQKRLIDESREVVQEQRKQFQEQPSEGGS